MIGTRGSAMGTMGAFHELGIGLGAIGGGIAGRALGLAPMFQQAGLAPVLGALAMVGHARARGTPRR